MPTFSYRAVNDDGGAVTGRLSADSAEDARARLRRMGLFPERVEARGTRAPGLLSWLPGARARSTLQVTLFTRQCATLLQSGVELVDALEVLAKQCEHSGLALALAEIEDTVRSGGSFADALADHPRFFDRSYVGMVASGEKSGGMEDVLSRLADFLERRRLLKARLSTAMIYPAILSLMVVGLLIFISGHVVPMISPILRRSKRPLPLSTWILFQVGDLVRDYLWAAVALVVLAAAVAVAIRRSDRLRAGQDAFLLRTPLFGKVLLKGLASRFAMSMAALLRSGVPALEAMTIVEGLTPNSAFAAEIARIRDQVSEGKDLSSGMLSSRLFLPMVSYMVAVGERSGALADVLERVSEAYDFEVEIAARRLLAILEPALVLVMAAVVGFIAMALMVGILELSHI